jgi:cytosol aminopeptidase family protein
MTAGGTTAARKSSLFLEVSAVAAEHARVDCLVVPLFSDERPLRESSGRADWRLCGRLSQVLAEGRLSGRRGDAVLVASFGGVAAPLVLGLGMGRRTDFDAQGIVALGREAVRRGAGLRVAAIALGLPESGRGDAGLAERIELLLLGAVEGLAAREGPPRELRLHVLVRPDELARAQEVARTSRPARLPAAVTLRSVETVERRDPRGARVVVASSRTADSVK